MSHKYTRNQFHLFLVPFFSPFRLSLVVAPWSLAAAGWLSCRNRRKATGKVQTSDFREGAGRETGRGRQGGTRGACLPGACCWLLLCCGRLLPRDGTSTPARARRGAARTSGAGLCRCAATERRRSGARRGDAAPLRSHRAGQPEPGTESRRPTGGGRRRRRPSGTAVLGLRRCGGELEDLLRRVLCESPAPPGRVWWNSGLS
jgi:hypothetical protein